MSSNEPFKNRILLYVMHFLFAFVSRMWDFGIVLLIAALTDNSLFLVAVTGLCSTLLIFLLMPTVGRQLDSCNRMVTVNISIISKFIAVTTGYAVCSYLNFSKADHGEELFYRILLYVLPVIGGIASMAFSTVTQSVEKDWIVVLSNGNSDWLSTTNSAMTQIDLACSSLAPAATGFIFAHLSHSIVALILLSINTIAAVGLMIFLRRVYETWPALGRKIGVDVDEFGSPIKSVLISPLHASSNNSSRSNIEKSSSNTDRDTLAAIIAESLNEYGEKDVEAHSNSNKEQTDNSLPYSYQHIDAIPGNEKDIDGPGQSFSAACSYSCIGKLCIKRFADFFQSGCVGVMVSYAALYLTVLSFGSLMTVYVRWNGITDDLIGLFRSLGALFGYLGALMFPFCSKSFGLWNSAQAAIIYQFILVFLAASSFAWASSHITVYIVMFAVLFSRTGLWLFDLCVRQIAQETISESVRGLVNGQWRSLVALFEMGSYIIAVGFPDPKDFWILSTVSCGMVGFALVMYTLSNPNASMRNMCCFDYDSDPHAYHSVPVAHAGSSNRRGGGGFLGTMFSNESLVNRPYSERRVSVKGVELQEFCPVNHNNYATEQPQSNAMSK